MKLIPKNLIRGLLLAGLLGGLTGCLVIKVNTGKEKTKCCGATGGGTLDNTPWPAQDGYTETFKPHPQGDPSGNSGQVIVLPNGFLKGSPHACFPASGDWNRYFPLPRYLVGPGVLPNAICYTNIDQLYQVTVTTCDTANGTVLETGIVIYEEYNPNTDKLCVTNSIGCPASAKLTINARPMEALKRYRATVFCKSGQIPASGVKITWSYP